MDEKTLLTIFVLILISSQLWTIVWDIGKSAFYLVVLLIVLTYINPDTAETVKGYGRRLLNLDSNLITESLSSVSKFIFGMFGGGPKKILSEVMSENKVIPAQEVPKQETIKPKQEVAKPVSKPVGKK